MIRRWIPLAIVCATSALTAGCKEKPPEHEAIRPVLSMLIEPTQAGDNVVVGTIEPRFKTDIGFRILGHLVSRPVNVGDLVEKGQTVAAIDPVALELAVRSATAEVLKTRAQLTTAIATEDRQRKLITTDSTTKLTLDNAEQGRAAAQSAVIGAEANLTKAREQLGYAKIQSDFAGVVTAVGAEVGQVVSPGQSVVTVARPEIREAVVDIGPDFPVPLRIGLPFTVSLQLDPTFKMEGQVREIAPQADPATRMRRVRIALNGPPQIFRLGTTVTASVNAGEYSALRLPASAVLAKNGESFVWIVNPSAGTVSLRKIEIAPEEAGIRVTGGLSAGERVVTAGIHSLKEGQQVRVQKDGTP